MGSRKGSRARDAAARMAAVFSLTALIGLTAAVVAAPAEAHHPKHGGSATSPSPTPTPEPSPSASPTPPSWLTPDPEAVLAAVADYAATWIRAAQSYADSVVAQGTQILADGTAISYYCWNEGFGYSFGTQHCRVSYQGITIQCDQGRGLNVFSCRRLE